MAKIVIVGAGRVGLACAKILHHIGETDVTLIDSNEAALASAVGFDTRLAYGADNLEAVMRDLAPKVTICSTPFYINIQVAKIAQKLGSHYIDFTEDNRVTREIEAMGVTRVTFVPQTGLAPGLITYIGLSLFEKLGEPQTLSLRVGALPQVSFGPDHYSMTWSAEGLINEYLNPATRKLNGIIEEVASLCEEEVLVVNGVTYEAFTTSGGVGNLASYDHIPTVEYKTLRYPGHLEFVQRLMAKVENDLDAGVAEAKRIFTTTRDDLVVLVAQAIDTDGKSASRGIHFYPHDELGLTALELTTSGTGVAVVELLLRGALPPGTLLQSDIPFALLRTTAAYGLIFSAAR